MAKWEKFERELRSAEDCARDENFVKSAGALVEIRQKRIINATEKAISRKQTGNGKIPVWNGKISRLKMGFNRTRRKLQRIEIRFRTRCWECISSVCRSKFCLQYGRWDQFERYIRKSERIGGQM